MKMLTILLAVTLAWNPNLEPVAGYRLYYGTQHPYAHVIDVGDNLSATVDVGPGVNYFAATAYDSLGHESAFSSEVQFTVAGVTPSPAPTSTPQPTPAPGSRPVITSLAIVDNATGQIVAQLVDRMVVRLSDYPPDLNVQAFTQPGVIVTQITFHLGGFRHVELTAPYALCGDWDPCPAFTSLGKSKLLWVQARGVNGVIGPTVVYWFDVVP